MWVKSASKLVGNGVLDLSLNLKSQLKHIPLLLELSRLIHDHQKSLNLRAHADL